MRRNDREIKDINEVISIIDECDTLRLAINNEGFPYIVPLNYGYRWDGSKIELYFHSATEGMKLDLMHKDNRASFEMDQKHSLKTDASREYCTMMYESVIGDGFITFIEDYDEKVDALQLICNHYHREGFVFSKAAVNRTVVYKLTVNEITGKRKC